MARVIPKSIPDRLQTFKGFAETWSQDPGAIGLTGADVTALEAALQAATAARDHAQTLRQQAESATLLQNDAVETLVRTGAGLIAKVRAAAAGDAAITARAHLPEVGKPTFTALAPPTPGDLTATPRSDGTVTLSWTSDLKHASFYRIERTLTIGGRTSRILLGVVRDDSYVDTTLPIGFTHVEYALTPVHQRRGGAPAQGRGCSVTYTPGRVGTPMAPEKMAATVPPALAA